MAESFNDKEPIIQVIKPRLSLKEFLARCAIVTIFAGTSAYVVIDHAADRIIDDGIHPAANDLRDQVHQEGENVRDDVTGQMRDARDEVVSSILPHITPAPESTTTSSSSTTTTTIASEQTVTTGS